MVKLPFPVWFLCPALALADDSLTLHLPDCPSRLERRAARAFPLNTPPR